MVVATSDVCVFSACQINGASNCEAASVFCLDSLCSPVSDGRTVRSGVGGRQTASHRREMGSFPGDFSGIFGAGSGN